MAIFPGAVSTDSDLYIAVNQTTTQLADNPLSNSATTVNVTSATAFPSVGYISIDAEIIKYTGTTAASFTGCTRGQDGTIAASHVQNSQVYHNIIAAHHNVLKDEVKAIEQNISDRMGLGSTQIKATDGTAALPSHTFNSDLDTGIYRPTTDALAVTVGGIATTQFDTTRLFMNVPLQGADGSTATPAISFANDTNTGIYRFGSDSVGFSAGGVLTLKVDTTGLVMNTGNVYINNGSASVPTLTFASDTDTGIFRQGSNVLSATAGGVESLRIDSSQIQHPDGSVSIPSINFLNDTDTGIYRIGADNIAITAGGTKRVDITNAGVSIQGTTTNNAAASGFVGQYIESIAAATNFPATATYGDLTSISLTAGDWDVSALMYTLNAGAAVTDVLAGISITTGNSASGLVNGSSKAEQAGPTSADAVTVSVPNYRMSLSVTTTVYFKYLAIYTVATPTAAGRISARRVR